MLYSKNKFIKMSLKKTLIFDGTKIDSIANRALLFDPSKLHSSTSCTDDKVRLNMNINYF